VIWFGGRKGHSLIMFDTATESFDTFLMPNRGASESLTVAKDGKIVCTMKTSSKIVLFDPKKNTFLEVYAAMGKSSPQGFDVDSKGNIWFADTPRNALFKMDGTMVEKLWVK
jgi:streptogramin lyase